MIKIENELYSLQFSDLNLNDNGIFIEMDDYINCSILEKDILIYPTIIYENNLKKIYIIYVSNGWGATIDYNDPDKILSYIQNQLPLFEQDYKLRLNILKTKDGVMRNISCDSALALSMYRNIIKQNINLSTDNLQIRQQDFLQKVDVKIPDDNIYTKIDIANHEAYNKNTPFINKINYLPNANSDLQNIIITMRDEKLKSSPPKYIQLQLLYNNNIICQVKNNISPSYNFIYHNDYGYKYGVIYDENNNDNTNNENVIIWSNNLDYDSNKYIIEWKLNQTQMEELKKRYNPENPFYFKCRYASEFTYNDIPIWNGWSINIENIKINNSPFAPKNLTILQQEIKN